MDNVDKRSRFECYTLELLPFRMNWYIANITEDNNQLLIEEHS
jgi:hypothetical protein